MKENENAGRTQPRENGAAHSGPEQQGNGSELNPDQELVYRLKAAIDQRGRYSFRLQDMAAGYAAGKGVSNVVARQEIENEFARHTGRTTQQYLDQHYQELKNTRSTDRSR